MLFGVQPVLLKSTVQSTRDSDTKQIEFKKIREMDYWSPSVKMLKDPHLLNQFANYDKDNVSHDLIQMIEPIIAKENF